MKEPKFTFGTNLQVINGFYKGTTGEATDVRCKWTRTGIAFEYCLDAPKKDIWILESNLKEVDRIEAET